MEPALQQLLSLIHDKAGATVWLVGGALRDLLRDARPNDLDIVVDGEVKALARSIAGSLAGHVFELDEERAQMRVVLEDGPVRELDLASLKGDLASDLTSRDFTVDALAAPIGPEGRLGEVVDPTGGIADLRAKLLRMTAQTALREDPLRLLRGVRLATELRFEIEAETAIAIRRNAGLLQRAAAERQRDELVRILGSTRSAYAARLLDSLGLLAQILPELMAARGVDQPVTHHYWDVFDHSIETLANLDAILSRNEPLDEWHAELRAIFRRGLEGFALDAYLDGRSGSQPRLVLLKLAGLLHDVSKPETKTLEADGRIRFFGHPEQGARKADRVCRRLRLGNREVKFVSQLVDEHLRPTQLTQDGSKPPTRRALYRFFRDLADAAPACLFLSLADGAAAAGPRLQMVRWQAMVSYVAYLLAESERLRRVVPPAVRLLTGRDVMQALDLQPGPLVGRLLAAIDEAIGAGEIETRDQAIEYARGLTSPPLSPSPSKERGKGERL